LVSDQSPVAVCFHGKPGKFEGLTAGISRPIAQSHQTNRLLSVEVVFHGMVIVKKFDVESRVNVKVKFVRELPLIPSGDKFKPIVTFEPMSAEWLVIKKPIATP